MRFKITIAKTPSHKAPVTCIGWSSTEEVYSAGDDNHVLSWSVSNNLSTKITEFAKEQIFPTDLEFLPRISGTLTKHGDLILITTADGKFHLVNRSGRIERTVEAHKGAILTGQWSNDGTGLLTAGEDGCIKIWSRSGMLRSTVVSSDSSVYGACWSPDSQSIAYTQGKNVVVKHLAPNTTPLKWKAHEELVLCLAWSVATELLVSGGEDCRYRVWDSKGRLIFSSGLHDNHITSIAWSPTGDLFAIGSYNTLRLCDYTGWSHSLEKPNTGCIYKMSWSADGTQLAAACANGHVLFAHVVERQINYNNYIATITERKLIIVRNVLDDTTEQLELPERIIQISMKYSYLVVTTPTQCYIYNSNNWNTPAIFDLKDGSVILLLLSERFLLLVERSNVGLYNYQGRLVGSPRWPNMRLDSLRQSHISLSSDILVVRDAGDPKIVHVIELGTNRSSNESTSTTIQHSTEIIQVALDQWGPATGRNLALMDKNQDLYLVGIRNANKSFVRLGRKIESFAWNCLDNILAAFQDTQLVIWYCPLAAYNATLLKPCSFQYDSPELGRSPRISDFVGNYVSIRRVDGSLINVSISPYPSMLNKYVQDNQWTDALNLCRSIENQTLWACLAVLATHATNSIELLDIAEEAYANIDHFDKVFYVQHVKTLPSKPLQKAAMALLAGLMQEADTILLQNGMVFQAIYNNINLYNWKRALELALKHKTHIDTVLFKRREYLEKLKKPENNNMFLELKETVTIDEEKVKQKIQMELEKDKTLFI